MEDLPISVLKRHASDLSVEIVRGVSKQELVDAVLKKAKTTGCIFFVHPEQLSFHVGIQFASISRSELLLGHAKKSLNLLGDPEDTIVKIFSLSPDEFALCTDDPEIVQRRNAAAKAIDSPEFGARERMQAAFGARAEVVSAEPVALHISSKEEEKEGEAKIEEEEDPNNQQSGDGTDKLFFYGNGLFVRDEQSRFQVELDANGVCTVAQFVATACKLKLGKGNGSHRIFYQVYRIHDICEGVKTVHIRWTSGEEPPPPPSLPSLLEKE